MFDLLRNLCQNIQPVTGTQVVVIAVDAVRRGRRGPYVAAAVAYRAQFAEPLFRFTDGRGALREAFLFQKPKEIRPLQIPKVTALLRNTAVAVSAFSLRPERLPDPRFARPVAMLCAVLRLSDRLKYMHYDQLEGVQKCDLRLLVASDTTLNSKHLSDIPQTLCPDRADWRLRAATFCALNAYPPIS